MTVPDAGHSFQEDEPEIIVREMQRFLAKYSWRKQGARMPSKTVLKPELYDKMTTHLRRKIHV